MQREIIQLYIEKSSQDNYTPIGDISGQMKKVAVSLEDRFYFRHRGIDVFKVIQAVSCNVLYKTHFGASTITQQLAKNIYLSPERTLRRKLKEAYLAASIERRLSKQQILELYLNVIYYGCGAYGISDAAARYFNCSPSRLSLFQSIALCAVIPAPSLFNPFANIELFEGRFRSACGVLLRHGDITENDISCLTEELEAYSRRFRSKEFSGRQAPMSDRSEPVGDASALVRYAYACMEMPTHYCWGGMGEIMTRELLNRKRAMYPKSYCGAAWDEVCRAADGRTRAFDCSGLIKCFLMGGLAQYSYDPALDMNSEMMLDRAMVKGSIHTMPEKPGICLYMPGHVGIYAGGGKVIEATSNPKFGNGVVMTSLTDRQWTAWFQSVLIQYD